MKTVPLLAVALGLLLSCGNSSRWNNPPGGVPPHPGGNPPVGHIEYRDDEPVDAESDDEEPNGENPYDSK